MSIETSKFPPRKPPPRRDHDLMMKEKRQPPIGKKKPAVKRQKRNDDSKGKKHTKVTKVIESEIQGNVQSAVTEGKAEEENYILLMIKQEVPDETHDADTITVKVEAPDDTTDSEVQDKPNSQYRINKYHCDECEYSTNKPSNLKTHQTTHTGKRPFKCSLCKKTFTAKTTVDRHIRCVHNGERPHQCAHCNKYFTDVGTLKQHSLIHTGEKPHQCTVCHKRFNNKPNMRRHMRIHTGSKPYVCKLCDKSFTDYSSLKLHLLHHSGEKPYMCEFCQKQFRTSSDLTRHVRTHTGEKPYMCKTCGNRFVQGWQLRMHEQSHTGVRNYSCDKCNKKFRLKAGLLTHLRTHTGEKLFKCLICSKFFASRTYLKDHQNLHSGDKPHTCEICGAGFRALSNLRRHNKTHSSKTYYNCATCGKNFKYSNSYQYHLKSHEGTYEFHCDNCDLDFKSRNGWKYHKCKVGTRETTRDVTNDGDSLDDGYGNTNSSKAIKRGNGQKRTKDTLKCSTKSGGRRKTIDKGESESIADGVDIYADMKESADNRVATLENKTRTKKGRAKNQNGNKKKIGEKGPAASAICVIETEDHVTAETKDPEHFTEKRSGRKRPERQNSLGTRSKRRKTITELSNESDSEVKREETTCAIPALHRKQTVPKTPLVKKSKISSGKTKGDTTPTDPLVFQKKKDITSETQRTTANTTISLPSEEDREQGSSKPGELLIKTEPLDPDLLEQAVFVEVEIKQEYDAELNNYENSLNQIESRTEQVGSYDHSEANNSSNPIELVAGQEHPMNQIKANSFENATDQIDFSSEQQHSVSQIEFSVEGQHLVKAEPQYEDDFGTEMKFIPKEETRIRSGGDTGEHYIDMVKENAVEFQINNMEDNSSKESGPDTEDF